MEHLLFLDIAEELITLGFALTLQVAKVVLKTVVRGFTGFALALVGVFTHPLHVTVNSVRALSVHHGWVTRVIGIGDVFTVH